MSGPGLASSFQKKSKTKIVSIPGTKPSVHNSQLLISTGILSLDFILGGGLPVGSVLLIEEDIFDVYSKLLLKLYLAEGVLNGHFVHLASLNEAPSHIFNDLPAPWEQPNQDLQSEDSNEKLEIAWRYQDKKSPEYLSKRDHRPAFDVTKLLDINKFTDKISSWDFINAHSGGSEKLSNTIYWSLLSSIHNKIKEHDLLPTPSKLKSNLLRIAIHSLLSPLWGCEYSKSERDKRWNSITSFFILLKAIIRSSFSVAVITVPSHLISDPALISRLHSIIDFGIKLESFQGSEKETNPLFKEYHGLFHIKKFPAINTMIPHQLDSLDWAFHLKRKTLSIRRLHLPPELSETANRSQEDNISRGTTTTCSGNLPRHLDF